MNLDEFVSVVLVNISKGVKDAQVEVEDFGGSVNPREILSVAGVDYAQIPTKETSIEFDILVEVSESNQNKGDGKLDLKVLSFGASGSSSDKLSRSQRIKFSVPLILPSCENPRMQQTQKS